MKKNLFLISCFFLCLNVFSLEEAWLAMGFSYGNSIDLNQNSLNTTSSYKGSMGINLSTYGFWDHSKVGLYFYFAGWLPFVVHTAEEIGDYRSVAMEFVLGPGFRYRIGGNLTAVYGCGLDVFLEVDEYRKKTEGNQEYSMFAANFGLGGDIGLKIDIGRTFVVSIGSALSFHFLNSTTLKNQYNSYNEEKVNALFSVKPYIAIGFNRNRENVSLS
ncbi:MAG: hypothetical protein Ta2B_15900 [Termitinemataceae bacterium]|nr:MAG: hypothetical protein Ta2B_15900 [Termitinemataceae bacterium]